MENRKINAETNSHGNLANLAVGSEGTKRL